MKTCKVEKCKDKIYSHDYCRKHYDQIRWHGKILPRIIRHKNKVIQCENLFIMDLYSQNTGELIAKTFFDGLYVDDIKRCIWRLHNGYAKTKYRGRLYPLSNYVMGDFEHQSIVDHIDRDRLNNLSSNLRIVSPTQNMINKGILLNNTTGFTGVSFYKKSNKYSAYITVNKKRIYLGVFTNIQDAAAKRKQAEIKFFGEYVPK